MWTMAIVPLVFVSMRLYVRVCLKRVFGWDDFIIIIAIVSTFYLLDLDFPQGLTRLSFR